MPRLVLTFPIPNAADQFGFLVTKQSLDDSFAT